MGILNNTGQKIKGKAQQFEGNIKNASGDRLGGETEKLKGKANETAADIKMKVEDSKF